LRKFIIFRNFASGITFETKVLRLFYESFENLRFVMKLNFTNLQSYFQKES